MSMKNATFRQEEVDVGISMLAPEENRQMAIAADGPYYGGRRLIGDILYKAIKLNLAFESSGRLKPDVYKLYFGD